MANLEKLVDDLSALTVLEAAELSKLLEEKWGVSAAAPVAVAAPLFPPLQVTEVEEVIEAVIAEGSEIVTEAVDVQRLASLTVTV